MFIDIWPINFFSGDANSLMDPTSLFLLQLGCILNMVKLKYFHGNKQKSFSPSPIKKGLHLEVPDPPRLPLLHGDEPGVERGEGGRAKKNAPSIKNQSEDRRRPVG